MENRLLEPGGAVVPVSALQIARAKCLGEFLVQDRLLYVRLVECRRTGGTENQESELVIIDVDVERPQRPRHPIRHVERMAVLFSPDDSSYPQVLALRADFPRVPHVNLGVQGSPRSLCLYDQPWSQVLLRWTPTTFVERIRYWLAQTARGALHQPDQPLEPLLFGSGYTIILPPDLFTDPGRQGAEQLEVRLVSTGEGARVLIATRPSGDKTAVAHVALSFMAKPQTHGLIQHAPGNLAELDAFLSDAGIPLMLELRKLLRGCNPSDQRLILVVGFPLIREGRQVVETTSLWGFLTSSTITEIGIQIGVWERVSGTLGAVLGEKPEADGRNVGVGVVTAQFDLSRDEAARSSGVASDERRIAVIGVGALGSQVVNTLVRSGFGRWCLVDNDVLLPHNFGRHALERAAIGHSKAIGMAALASRLYSAGGGASGIAADVLSPGKHGERLQEALDNADLILDMAASVPVSRHLANDVGSPARRAALFLNPRGSDLVLLAEDRGRTLPLDCLEMQYLRAVSTLPELKGHLAAPEDRIRYGRSCRDVSSTIPNHLVALHSSIGARAVRTAVAQDGALLRVWRADAETLEVRMVDCPVTEAFRTTSYGWTLVVDRYLIERMASLRKERLPNETGGVLIGAYDLGRRVVYVVDTVASPPDSEEWPTLYIRGSEGLAERVAEISQLTGGMLEYVGEWHSHPEHCACEPSDDDLLVFSWLTRNMGDAGLPGLMAIAGSPGSSTWFLGEMARGTGWRVE